MSRPARPVVLVPLVVVLVLIGVNSCVLLMEDPLCRGKPPLDRG